jgi:hypothetical protein
MYCARHPKVETALSCGKCGTPICPDCSVSGPVGMRCRSCASLRTSSLYQVKPERFALATVLGLIVGTGIGVALQFISGVFFYFMFFAGPGVGGLLGEVILISTGRKRGLKLEILAGASVVAGAIISLFLSGGWLTLLHSPMRLVMYVIAVALTASAAVGRIRYM